MPSNNKETICKVLTSNIKAYVIYHQLTEWNNENLDKGRVRFDDERIWYEKVKDCEDFKKIS